MAVRETVELRGHLLDTGLLTSVLDDIREYGADYTIEALDVGKDAGDESYVRLVVRIGEGNGGEPELDRVLMRLQTHGVNQVDPGEAVTCPADMDATFPERFYSTTNLETWVRIEGRWIHVDNPEMDLGLIVEGEPGARTVRTLPMTDVREGDLIVCGASGIRVETVSAVREKAGASFDFMSSDVSSEKPMGVMVAQIADQMRAVRDAGQKVLWVGGPAVVHTGAAPAMVALVDAGYVDILFAGNALATHDIESALYGTSLGIDLAKGSGVEHGHEHHVRAINSIRRCGSIAAAVEQGVLTGGVMHALVRNDKEFVLVGSVRDDGPLPDVYTDVIQGQKAMRAALADVGFVIMVATMLHSIATGNLLPARIPLVCVDINPVTVTKLADRGSTQARGIVTDIGLFLEHLAQELVPGYKTKG